MFGEICADPVRFRRFRPPARRHFSRDFPYAVIFLGKPGYIWIVAVMHMRRQPGYWRARLGHDGEHRHWEDCRKYGFPASGYGRCYTSQLDRLEVGSIAAAYQPKSGYLGLARIIAKAVPSRDFRHHGRPLRPGMLAGPELLHDAEDDGNCEYLVSVEWIKHVPLKHAKFRRRAGLFASRLIVATLSEQAKTRHYLEQQFKVNFERLLGAK